MLKDLQNIKEEVASLTSMASGGKDELRILRIEQNIDSIIEMVKVKAFYIFEYDDGNQTQAEWFIADDELSYVEMEQEARQHLADNWDCYVKEVTVDIENVYRVADNMIDAVYESRK